METKLIIKNGNMLFRRSIQRAQRLGSQINELFLKTERTEDGGYGCECPDCQDIRGKNAMIYSEIDKKTDELRAVLGAAFNLTATHAQENTFWKVCEKYHVWI